MKPNDLPLVCLPMDLSDEAAAALVEFLSELVEALESHYARAAAALCAPTRTRRIAAEQPDHRPAVLIPKLAVQYTISAPPAPGKSAPHRQSRADLRRR